MSTSVETLGAEVTQAATESGVPRTHDDPPAQLTMGTEIGRYVVLRTLGRGGMGTVYLAYDPELDRKLALKLLRGPTSANANDPLRREAQAMARLRHPNVVAVHDVGQHRGQLYVAMNFVEGRTLDAWSKEQPRGWREVLEVFSAAGRGLQAAHARGLIHRDFKPENVMVSDEGHVLVMDFGLARLDRNDDRKETAAKAKDDDEPDVRSLRISALEAKTRGRMAGTPAYMAPEQIMGGGELGPATDQFAFCVSVWEVLCGQRPFDGELLIEMFSNISTGRIRPTPPGVSIPRWLERVLRRGLDPSPAVRWPSMEALLAEFDRGRRRWRWQAGLGAVAVLATAGAIAWGLQQQQRREQRQAEAACEAEGAAIDEVWNDAQRERVRAGMLAAEQPYASDSLETLTEWLDDYHGAWKSGRAEVCRHRSIARDWDEPQVDRASWCFEDRRLQLEATVEQIATLDKTGLRRAVRIASYLEPVQTCMEPASLQHFLAPPVELRHDIRSIRAVLVQSDRHRHAGRYAEALELAREARQKAETLGWPPLLVLAQFIEGRCILRMGKYAKAEALLTIAYFEAQQIGSYGVAFRAARSLISVNLGQRRYLEAEQWSHHADILATELEDPGRLNASEGHHLRMHIYSQLGNHPRAAEEGEQAVALRASTLGDAHPITAASMADLSLAYSRLGRLSPALDMLKRASSIWTDAVGDDHPYIGIYTTLRSGMLRKQGYIDRALDTQRKGLDIYARTLRVDHPRVAGGSLSLARSLLEKGQLDDAQTAATRAMDIWRAAYSPRHPQPASGLLLLSAIDRARGLHDAALAQCTEAQELYEASMEPLYVAIANALECAAEAERGRGRLEDAIARRTDALARRTAVAGSQSPQLVKPLVQLGDLQRQGGRIDEAQQSYDRALELAEHEPDAGGSARASVLIGLAELALDQDAPERALPLAERAVELVDRNDVGPRLASAAHFAAARALWSTGDPGGYARAIAERARDEYAMTYDQERLDVVEQWLAELPGASPWAP